MSDAVLQFLELLRSGEGVAEQAQRILASYRCQEADMSKVKLVKRVRGMLSNGTATELRRRAKDARRRAGTSTNDMDRLVQIRRARDFEKLAEEAEH
ncbi:hypothetical protein [Pseudorhodoplanes sinuspersici]|nr:hypothetical protein [Pseudorhodoplanes sinuspersici]